MINRLMTGPDFKKDMIPGRRIMYAKDVISGDILKDIVQIFPKKKDRK